MTQREEIVASARKYLGARWSHQGRADDKMDCAGLVIKVATEMGFIDWDVTDYERQATDERMLKLCREHLIEIKRSELLPGDLVVLAYGQNRHIGITGDYPHGGVSLIHAQAMFPRIVGENRLCDEWLQIVGARIVGCFQFPEKL